MAAMALCGESRQEAWLHSSVPPTRRMVIQPRRPRGMQDASVQRRTAARSVEPVELGKVEELRMLPLRVEIASAPYFLVRNGGELRLLASVCPHKGGIVQDAGDRFQ